jgi:hypothetical protein
VVAAKQPEPVRSQEPKPLVVDESEFARF